MAVVLWGDNDVTIEWQLMPLMDKWIMTESLLPMLEHIQSREPGVLMAMLGMYDEVRFIRGVAAECLLMMSSPPFLSYTGLYDAIVMQGCKSKRFGFDKEMLANRVLPKLLSLSIEPCLNSDQVCVIQFKMICSN